MQHVSSLPLAVSAPSFATGWRALIRTRSTWSLTVARLALGAALLPHGLQKLFGWFGGYGLTNTLAWFTETMHVPWIFAVAAIVAETLGALALLLGVLTRVAAAATGVVYVTAIALVHAPHGFFMNWAGNQAGEGIEYFILGLGLVAIVVAGGGGAASVDRWLGRASR